MSGNDKIKNRVCDCCGTVRKQHYVPEEMINLKSIVAICEARKDDTVYALTKDGLETIKNIAQELIYREHK